MLVPFFPQNLSWNTWDSIHFCYFPAVRCLSFSVNQNPISNWPTYQGGMYPKRQTHPDRVEKSGVHVYGLVFVSVCISGWACAKRPLEKAKRRCFEIKKKTETQTKMKPKQAIGIFWKSFRFFVWQSLYPFDWTHLWVMKEIYAMTADQDHEQDHW